MTYCVALKLNAGMVFASDSRTNAGIDQIACFKKMRSFVNPGDRSIVILSSGNLSVTQNAINQLEQKGRHPEQRNVWNAESMFEVAQLLGEALRDVRQRDGLFLAQNNIDASASFIVGGQIQREDMRLFMVYAEGNFIEAGDETPYFQIGETKYGKPIIDRVIKADTPLCDAIKCLLVSFDSTMRSNLSVGLPIDLACYNRASLRLDLQQHITSDDPYFSQISHRWSDGLKGVFASLPNPEWLIESGLSDASRPAQEP
ncbi:MAG: proteasome-type protease [Methylomonas sp.]|nr:proteasome-type protease [Methylomonas sp.]PPD20440.1 MAG: peptidase [Methylomonas sp.]PPD26706.1 MAG: peptidase [Methylomonas sp.]PPD38526.1 MAG: peptidase [Methylomonas sp.]PPD40165.1 MAG: peptidase [Methylomonas sp.]